MAWMLILLHLFAFKGICPSIIQMPEVAIVPLGGTVTLNCSVESVMSKCSETAWHKIHPRTGQLKPATAVKIEVKSEERAFCTGVINNASRGDSGIYYCNTVSSVISYMGTGSKVIVTEPNTQPDITVYTPDESLGSDVSLQCLVLGVAPLEAHISWVVSETAHDGWSESGWTDHTESATQFTRSYLTLSSDIWMDGAQIECIVELDGRMFSKSMTRALSHTCMWILYLASGFASLIIVGAVVAVVYLHRAKTRQENTATRETLGRDCRGTDQIGLAICAVGSYKF